MNENKNNDIVLSEELERRIEELARTYSDLMIDVYYDKEDESDEIREQAVMFVKDKIDELTLNLIFKKELEKTEREAE